MTIAFREKDLLPKLSDLDKEIREFGEKDLLPDLSDLPVDDDAMMLN